MGIVDLLRSVLGLGDSGDSAPRERTDATVERGPSRESNGSNEAPHGSDDRSTGRVSDPEADPVAPKPDATASADSAVKTSGSDPDAAVEPPGDAQPAPSEPERPDTSGDTTDGADDATGTVDTDDSDEADDAPDDTGDAPKQGASVDTINGIGPAYTERLGNAGIETVPELLAADTVSLAEATDISEKRIARWQGRAAE